MKARCEADLWEDLLIFITDNICCRHTAWRLSCVCLLSASTALSFHVSLCVKELANLVQWWHARLVWFGKQQLGAPKFVENLKWWLMNQTLQGDGFCLRVYVIQRHHEVDICLTTTECFVIIKWKSDQIWSLNTSNIWFMIKYAILITFLSASHIFLFSFSIIISAEHQGVNMANMVYMLMLIFNTVHV